MSLKSINESFEHAYGKLNKNGDFINSINESATAEGKIVVTEDPYYVIAYSDGEGTYYYSDRGSYNVDFRGARYYDIDRISDNLDNAVIFDTEDEAEEYLSTANKYLFYFYEHIDARDSRYGGGFDFDFNDGSVEDLIDWLGSGMEVVKIGGDEPKVYHVTSDEVTDKYKDPLKSFDDLENTDGVFLNNIKIDESIKSINEKANYDKVEDILNQIINDLKSQFNRSDESEDEEHEESEDEEHEESEDEEHEESDKSINWDKVKAILAKYYK